MGIVAARKEREATAQREYEATQRARAARHAAAAGGSRVAGQRVLNNPPNSAGMMMQLLRPADLQKYKTLAKQRTGLRHVEEGLNRLERESGIDLDGDGDLGLANAPMPPAHTPPPPPACSRSEQSRPHMNLRGEIVHMPERPDSYRDRCMVPISRDHATPDFELHRSQPHVGGVTPGYMGHVPRSHNQFGIALTGGLHADATGDARDCALHFDQSNEIYFSRGDSADGRGAPARAVASAVPGYAAHMPSTAQAPRGHHALGISAFRPTSAGLLPHQAPHLEPSATEQRRLHEGIEPARHTSRLMPHPGRPHIGHVAVPGYDGYVRDWRDRVGVNHRAMPFVDEQELSA